MAYLSLVKKFLVTQDIKERGELLRFIEPVADTQQSQQQLTTLNNALHVESKITDPNSSIYLSENVATDIELFQNYDGSTNGTVFESLSASSHTTGAGIFLKSIMNNPIRDTETIEKRQSVIASIRDQAMSQQDQHKQGLNILKHHEPDINWLFELKNASASADDNQNLNDLYDMVYFRFVLLRKFNSVPAAITGINLYKMFASPAIGILSPIAYFIIPYMIFRWKFEFKLPFTTYMKFMFSTMIQGDLMSTILIGSSGSGASGFASRTIKWLSFMFSMLFYFQGLFNSVDVARTTYKIAKFLTTKANSIAAAIKAADTLITDLWSTSIEDAFGVSSLCNNTTCITQDFKPFSVVSNFGQSLAFLKNIDYDTVASRIKMAYVIDALYGIARHLDWCFVKFNSQSKTNISFQDTWHICLEDSKVTNSITLTDTNMILTGPNAGGKSTFIKTVLINIILGQTLGIACARAATFTPFDIIHTQINIPDCKGKESLFEAEMYRCKRTLDLCHQHPDRRKLIIMDEIFNSTNPVEGIAGAYAVAKKISSDNRALLMFTTHFIYLTKLHRTGRFENYRMNVDVVDGGGITFPYKLSKGVSRQHVALELLRKNGFDKRILDDAIEIKNKLTSASETGK